MTSRPGALPEGTQPGRTALRIVHREETAAFYREVVGLETVSRDGRRDTLGVDDQELVVLIEDRAAPERDPTAAGLFHCAIRVPTRAALGDALRRVRDGWELDGASDHRVSEALYLTDPEGNGVEIYRDKPRDAWPTAADGTVRMDTLPLDLEALAADGDGESGAPPGTTIGHVHLEVTDLDVSRRFYVDPVGLGVRQEWGDSALFLAAGDYHHHVGLNAWNGRTKPAGGRGLAWFELVVPDRSALAGVRDRAEADGLDVAPVENGIEIVDPDGMALRVRPA
ncbi:MAG: VOC family protein [archaeon]